ILVSKPDDFRAGVEKILTKIFNKQSTFSAPAMSFYVGPDAVSYLGVVSYINPSGAGIAQGDIQSQKQVSGAGTTFASAEQVLIDNQNSGQEPHFLTVDLDTPPDNQLDDFVPDPAKFNATFFGLTDKSSKYDDVDGDGSITQADADALVNFVIAKG